MNAGAAARCPRCGSFAVADAAFCPRCGRYLAPLVWVATPPSVPGPARPAPARRPYSGPPRYLFRPRGGLNPGPWVPDEPAPVAAASRLLPPPIALLWATASVCVVAAGAECWRYLLLLSSRSDALDARAVRTSDALVAAAATMAAVVGLSCGVLLVRWTVAAVQVAGERARVRPARSRAAVVLGWVVPGLNLAAPGAMLAEIEHCALDRPPAQRPRPSRLLLVWWALWAADVVLAAVVLLWALRSGVQARADGVVLHGVLDVVAAATAVVGAALTARLTRLLAPARAVRREIVVAVRETAPDSPPVASA